MLIPSLVDYFFPADGKFNYVATNQDREFEKEVLFVPNKMSTGIKKSSEIYPELIKNTTTNLKRREMILECLDNQDFTDGQFVKLNFTLSKIHFSQGLEVYQMRVGYYQFLQTAKMKIRK